MNPKTQHALWQGPAGDIEVSIDHPSDTAVGLAVIAHPHPLFGGTKDNKVVQTLARAFLQLGHIAVRFNFRGVGKSAGQHDHGQGEASDMAWLVEQAHRELLDPSLAKQPVALAGFSFGAFVTSHVATRLREQLPLGKMVLVGTAASRFEVAPVPEDTLVIHGEVDDTVPLQSVLDWARPQDLPVMVMPGVEHFFHGKLPQLKAMVVRYYPS
ncbi:alpha/beta hydrolase [Limnobacter sp.]|uniref:alpha/beta hydrolase n=1 Tax=Limnobacter sp. TaxID=2003368 RepID=UPI0035180997